MTGSPSPTWAGMPRWSLKVLGLVLGLGTLLAGLMGLNHLARQQLHERERYALAFEDIDCEPPPGMRRGDFLDEVQYLSGLPAELRLLDEDLPARLASGFARHPWVEKVERVEVYQPRRVRVQLVYRTPVLVVRARGPGHRAVDRSGIVLPAGAELKDLPALIHCDKPPAGPSGAPWGDARVAAAAKTAAVLKPCQGRLGLTQVEATAEGLIWTAPPNVRVLWGQPPGREKPGEASASQKVARLLSYCQIYGSLAKPGDGPIEHDVRARAKALHRPLGTRPK